MKNWPKEKSSQVGVALNIAQNHFSSSYEGYLGFIFPNSHEKLTKSEIRLSWSW